MTLPGHSNVRQGVAVPSWLQLCAVSGSSGIKLSEYIYTLCLVLPGTYHGVDGKDMEQQMKDNFFSPKA
jgi:hypothetical protein